MKNHKQLLTIQVKKKDYPSLKKVLKEIAGCKGNYPLTDAQHDDDNIEVQVIFTKLSGSSRRYLKSFLKRRKAKIVNDMAENNSLLNPESKKALANASIAFAITMVASVFSINPIAAAMTLQITFVDSLIYGLGPSFGAFGSHLFIHYKR